MPGSGGYLTTHILDTARGLPASGVVIELFQLRSNSQRSKSASATTNADGRTDTPILPETKFQIGTFELIFHIGDYFRHHDLVGTPPLFLDQIPIRFGINDATAHYHVPLLISPFGYSTYRGS